MQDYIGELVDVGPPVMYSDMLECGTAMQCCKTAHHHALRTIPEVRIEF